MFSKSSIYTRTTLRISYVFEKKIGFSRGKKSDFREKIRIFEEKNRILKKKSRISETKSGFRFSRNVS